MEELFYQIALTQTEQIGCKLARGLLQRFGSAESVFKASIKQLESISNLGKSRIRSLRQNINKVAVEKELAFIEKHKIKPLFINDTDYPKILREIPDAPIMLYYKGSAQMNGRRTVAIVGTRSNTDYGRQVAEALVSGFKGQDILIVSGLASGMDTIAHKAALKNGLETIGVLGHGLGMIYPASNRKLASDMTSSGGLLTEFTSGTTPERQNFPQRNRIVAGMADVTVVVETGEKGGSMITAKLACAYNREVVTFPGRAIDNRSRGCNYLIKTNIAHLITDTRDLLEVMNWQPETREQKAIQQKLFDSLNTEEKKVVDTLANGKEIHIDELTLKTAISDSKMAAILLSLELDGLIRSLPGKRYRLT